MAPSPISRQLPPDGQGLRGVVPPSQITRRVPVHTLAAPPAVRGEGALTVDIGRQRPVAGSSRAPSPSRTSLPSRRCPRPPQTITSRPVPTMTASARGAGAPARLAAPHPPPPMAPLTPHHLPADGENPPPLPQ